MAHLSVRNIACLFLMLVLLFAAPHLFGQADRDRETAVTANNFYKEGRYAEAVPLFAQLLSNHPGDSRYEYFYGVSRYQSGSIPGDAVKHLEKAAKDNDIPRDVWYYLARCYHLTYHFTEAKEAYLKFKTFASQKQADELEVDLNILMCKAAIQLPDKSEKYLIHDKLITSEDDFLSIYKLDPLRDGRILTLTETYKSAADKKKNDRQYLFLEPSGTKMYYSSRGVDGENSSDLISVTKKINKWEKAAKIAEANSKFDEIYPTSAKDGKIIYFSAKSPQSMGGFDIFKVEYNSETNKWSKPENMGAPVNSPADDFLFASSVLEHCSYITTNRDCEKGKLCVMKIEINTPAEGSNINIRGKFINNDRPNEFQVTIQFFNQDNWKLLGEAKVDTKTGEYYIKLPYVQRYATRIDVVGYSLLLGEFRLRFGKKHVVQEILLNKQNTGEERFVINNTYPEDLQLILMAQSEKTLENKTPEILTPVAQDFTTNKLNKAIASSNGKPKNTSITSSALKPTKSFLIPAPELKPVRTFNWNAEKAKLLLTFRPKEDAEIVSWVKDEKKKKEIPVALQPQEAQPAEIPFNLEDISLENLQNAQPVAGETGSKKQQVSAEDNKASMQHTVAVNSNPETATRKQQTITEPQLVFTETKNLSASAAPGISSDNVTAEKHIPVQNISEKNNTGVVARVKRFNAEYILPKEYPVKTKEVNLKLRPTEIVASVNISKILLPDAENPDAAVAEISKPSLPSAPPNLPLDGYQKTVPPSNNIVVDPGKTENISSSINAALAVNETISSAQSNPIFQNTSLEKLTYSDNLTESKTPAKPALIPPEHAVAQKNVSLENMTYAGNLERSQPHVNMPPIELASAQKQEAMRSDYAASLRYKLKLFENKSNAQVGWVIKGLGN